MKNLFLTICLIITRSMAFSLQLALTATSFDSTVAILPGSAQTADVQFVAGPYVGSDRLQIYIQYQDNSGFFNGALYKCFDTAFYPFYFNLPQNTNGTRTVHFNMPQAPTNRAFRITANLAPTTFYGVFNLSVILGIRQNTASREIKEINYFTINGQQLSEQPIGFFIKQTIFEDGTFESKQIFVTK